MQTTALSKRLVAFLCCLAVCAALSAVALGASLASRAQADDASGDGIALPADEAPSDNYVIEEEIPAPPEDTAADEANPSGEPAGAEEITAAEEEPVYTEPGQSNEPDGSAIPENTEEPAGMPADADEADEAEPAGSDEPGETNPAGTDGTDEASDPTEADSDLPGEADAADGSDAVGEDDADAEAGDDLIGDADADNEADGADDDEAEADDEADTEDADDEEEADSDEDEYGIMLLASDGTTGDVSWELSDEGVLRIFGEGAMKNGVRNDSSPWYDDRETITTVIIEEGVTNIGSYAFYGCTNLTEISIPETVTTIGSYVFNKCSSLESIEIPEGVTAIGDYAFYGWSGLTHISIPSGVTSIGMYAFSGCTGLEYLEIPSGVTTIGMDAFDGCTNLREIILPEGLTDLGAFAFKDCAALQNMVLPAGITELPQQLFYNCTSLTSVTANATVTSINSSAFSGCTSLQSVFDLSNVAYMGTKAFYNCSSLTGTVDLSSLETVNNEVFYGCSSITGVIFGDQLTAINQYAFFACNNLTELSLPEGLQTIGKYAFWNCWLDGDAMTATTTVSSGAALYTKDSGETVGTTEELSYTGHTLVIPSSVTSIGENAFEYSDVDIFVIGSNLTGIDGSAFASWSLEAVIFDNFQDLVNISNLAALWGHTDNNVNVVYRLGTTGVYLNGVTGSDDNDGSFDNPVATFDKAKELAEQAGVSYIMVTGTVTVSGTETWNGGLTLYRDASFTDGDLILVSGNGSLTLTDITIDGQNIESSSSLILVQGEGAQLTITDGAIIQNALLEFANTMNTHDHGAICVRNGTLIMNGGEIRNNTGTTFGGGIALLGYGPDANVQMDLSGGTISGNTGRRGGGIYLYGYATLNMTGGVIDSNTATMNGGGIYIGSGGVAEISAGYITNNHQTVTDDQYGGGGIYVDYGTTAGEAGATMVRPAGIVYLYNVEITDNSFERSGDSYRGTIASCTTGSVEINITKGAVIHDNDESKTIIIYRDDKSAICILPAIMLGGGAYNWIDFGTGEPLDLDGLVYRIGYVNALTHVSTSDGTVTGLDRCTTFITGNTAVNIGSAIGSNGNVVIGYNDGDVTIDIEKIWNVSDGDLPESITVYIDATDGYGVTTRIGSVTLNADNGWKATITELPKYDSDGLEYTYTVVEETLGGMISEVTGGKTESSGNDYDSDVDKTASYVFTLTNTSAVELSLTKEAVGSGAPETFEFEITLSQDGEPFNSDVTATYTTSSGDVRTAEISFVDGTATVEIASGETVALVLPAGLNCSITELTTGADTIVVTDSNGNVIATVADSTTQAVAEIGTVHASTQVTFTNSYREYYPIDEEIVPDESDRDSWVKDESVNEYNAIEIEMSTYLPVITSYDLTHGTYTMNFHEQLNSQLVLDEVDADFSVAIASSRISHQYYTVTIDPDDGCTFHVDVDLTALYNDGVITEDDLLGTTEIMVFFYADLEGTGLNGTYESTVWYDIYDGDEILYTSNVDVVYVYTYEIEILKVDAATDEALSGATLGVYYDAELSDPVSRNGEPYTVTSGDDGSAMFFGLAAGTYYIAEVAAPDGYLLSADVLEVVLNENTVDDNYIYRATFSNTLIPETITVTVTKIWDDADDQDGLQPESITVQLLANGEVIDEQILSADNGWTYSWDGLDAYENGDAISYSVIEPMTPEGYSQTNSGLVDNGDGTYSVTITNTHTPDSDIPEPKTTVDVTVVKVWDDNDDLYGARPDKVVVVLLENGKATTMTQLLSEENGWCGTFTDLPEYSDDGERIVYTIAEVTVPYYSSVIAGDQDSGFTVTNTYDEPDIPEPDIPEPGIPEPDTPEPGTPEPGNPEPMPQTGQNSLPIAPLALAGAAIVAAGAGAVIIWRRRVA